MLYLQQGMSQRPDMVRHTHYLFRGIGGLLLGMACLPNVQARIRQQSAMNAPVRSLTQQSMAIVLEQEATVMDALEQLLRQQEIQQLLIKMRGEIISRRLP